MRMTKEQLDRYGAFVRTWKDAKEGEVVVAPEGIDCTLENFIDFVRNTGSSTLATERGILKAGPCAYCDRHVLGDVCKNCGARR